MTASPTALMALTARPGLARALGAVRSAEIGLLRAVALDIVALGPASAADAPADAAGGALQELGPEAIEVLRRVTGPTSLDLQAHSTRDGRATTFLARAGHGVVVSAHLSLIPGERPEHLRAALRIVGTHGSMLVDLLRPQLEVRTAAGATHVPFGEPGPADPSAIPPGGPSDALSGIAESARSGRRLTITW